MKPTNEMEKKVAEMIRQGKPLHGMAKDIAIEMLMRRESK